MGMAASLASLPQVPEPDIGGLPQTVLVRIMSHFVGSVVGLWRLRGVARDWLDWATATLARMPRPVAIAGTEQIPGVDNWGVAKRIATATIEVLDLSTMRWSVPDGAPPPLPDPRSSHFSCVLGEGGEADSGSALRVVVVGGINFGADEPKPELKQTGVEWEVGSAEWRPISPLPMEYVGASSGLGISAGLFLFGGDVEHSDGDGNQVMIMSLESTTPPTVTWSDTRRRWAPSHLLELNMKPMNEERDMAAAAMLPDGRIFVAGGMCYQNGFGGGQTDFKRTAEVFDPATGAWTSVPEMAQKRAGAAACLLESGDVMVVGGFSDSHTRRCDAELFDPVTMTWRSVQISHMNFVRGTPGCAAVPGGAIVVGGLVEEEGGEGIQQRYQQTNATNELYDEESGKWLKLPHAMAKPRVTCRLITLPAAVFAQAS